MKKIVSIALLVMMIAIPVFAGGGAEKSGKTRVAYFVFNYSDTQMSMVMDAASKMYEGTNLDVQFYDGRGDQSVQNDQITTAITQGAKMLVVGMTANEASKTIVEQARAADIPVVFYNNRPLDGVVDSYEKCWFIGTNPRAGGVTQAEIAYNFLKDDITKWDRNGDKKLQYVLIRASYSQPEADGRSEGSVTELGNFIKADGYTMEQVGEDYLAENWSAEEGLDRMSTCLTQFPVTKTSGPEIIFGNNDSIAIGAMKALQANGWNTSGSYDNMFIPVIGVDKTPEATGYIDSKNLLGSAQQSADLMAEMIVAVTKAVEADKDPVADAGFKFEDGLKELMMPYVAYPASF